MRPIINLECQKIKARITNHGLVSSIAQMCEFYVERQQLINLLLIATM